MMTNSTQCIAVNETQGVWLLTVLLQRIESYEKAEAMGRELIAAIQDKTSPRVVVEMSKLTYMSSVGYGPLISLRSYVREAGGRLVLCGLSPVVKEMFETTRLLINPHSPKSLFEFVESKEQAIAMLQA